MPKTSPGIVAGRFSLYCRDSLPTRSGARVQFEIRQSHGCFERGHRGFGEED